MIEFPSLDSQDAKSSRPTWKKRVILPAAFVVIAVVSVSGCQTTEDAKTAANTAATAAASAAGKAPAAAKKTVAKAAAQKPAAVQPAIAVSSKTLIAVLEANALKAKKTYKGKRVVVSGFVGNIDASGKYFSLDPERDAFVLTGVQVYTSKKFQDQIANFSKNQPVTVTGTISDVGELMGYSLEAESIK